jgi:hypothetical protein
MEKQAIKEIMYGSINELMQNRKFYHRSSIGQQYSHWTDEGRETLFNYIEQITAYIYDAEQKSLDERSKAIMLDTLKS